MAARKIARVDFKSRFQNPSLLPPPGCKGTNMAVALPLKGGEIFWGRESQTWQDNLCPPHILRHASFVLLATPSPKASR